MQVGGATELNFDGKSVWINSLSTIWECSGVECRILGALPGSVGLGIGVDGLVMMESMASAVPPDVDLSKSTRLLSFSSSNAVLLLKKRVRARSVFAIHLRNNIIRVWEISLGIQTIKPTNNASNWSELTKVSPVSSSSLYELDLYNPSAKSGI